MNIKQANETQLQNFQNLIKNLKSSTKTKSRKEILARFPQSKMLLQYTYDAYKIFGITSYDVKKNRDNTVTEPDILIFKLLDKLKDLSFEDRLKSVNSFINSYPDFEEEIFDILDKNTRTKITPKIINDVFPKSIPVFSPQSFAISKQPKLNYNTENYLFVRPEGLRILIRIERGDITYFTEDGKNIQLGIDSIIRNIGINNVVFDTIIGYFDEINFNEHQIINQLSKLDSSKFTVNLFDMFGIKEFDIQTSFNVLSKRLDRINDLPQTNQVNVISQIVLKDKEHLEVMLDHAVNRSWNSIIIRENTNIGEGKSIQMSVFTEDKFEIKSINYAENKIEEIESLTIEYKGNKLEVSNGLTFNERINPINQKSVIIKYLKEIKTSKTYTLENPIFVKLDD